MHMKPQKTKGRADPVPTNGALPTAVTSEDAKDMRLVIGDVNLAASEVKRFEAESAVAQGNLQRAREAFQKAQAAHAETTAKIWAKYKLDMKRDTFNAFTLAITRNDKALAAQTAIEKAQTPEAPPAAEPPPPPDEKKN